MAPVLLTFLILAGVIAIPFAIFALVYLIVPACKGIGWLFMQVFNFITGEIGDALRIVGSIITTIVLIPLTVINVLIGRWSASAHYGRAIQNECVAMGRSLYRIAIGHPARLFCLTPLTEGLEKRIPEVVAAAPGADRPGKRQGQFDGYAIIGSLPGGGSGGRLYIAEPSAEKIAAFSKQGQKSVGRVVIKSFSLADGSTLPQIVRENRALPAAKRMGLILEHDLTEERFYYVTRYVPGESLGIATQRLHAGAGSGLDRQHLRTVCGYATDLLRTLTHYHEGGLWHKDVKPDNIIVADGQAHLVDFGLVTPLRSSMTLTTHGTEYFRDPEMVRMALRGVKVHEVDGAKFDIYAAGAVLYSMIENSFPAHGGLSQISKPCPEALRWIVRRAMTDYDKRYESAALMLEDIQTVCTADDPFAVKPFALPSMRGSDAAHHGAADQHGWEGMAGPVGAAAAAAAAASVGAAPAPGAAPSFGRKPGPVAAMLGQVGEYVDSALGQAGLGSHPANATITPSRPLNGPVIRRVFELVSQPGGIATADFLRELGYSDRNMRDALRNLRDNYGVDTTIDAEGRIRVLSAQVADKPHLKVTNWWSGKYEVVPGGPFVAVKAAAYSPASPSVPPIPSVPSVPARPRNPGSSAAEQLVRARGRARVAQDRAQQRMTGLRNNPNVGMNVGVGLAVMVFLGACGLFTLSMFRLSTRPSIASSSPAMVNAAPDSLAGSDIKLAVSRAGPDESAAFAQVADAVGRGIVVLRDPIGFQESSRQAIDRALQRLSEMGMGLIGGMGADSEPADDLTVAELRNAIGVAPFHTAESEAAIRAWLDEHDSAAAAVWIGRHEGGEPTAWLITSGRIGAKDADAMAQALTGKPVAKTRTNNSRPARREHR